ncbi:MAG: four helix bundle protein [Terriglobales bacterium]
MVLGFRELRVWQAAMDLVAEIYVTTGTFPRNETYGLSSQLRRAAVSVASNIAEGQGREHVKEFLHFLSLARASLAELITEIEIAGRLHFVAPDQSASLVAACEQLYKQLFALRRSLLVRPVSVGTDPKVARAQPTTDNR